MYKKLFTPLRIGNVTIPNRLAVTAMVANFNTVDGMATERYIAYHEEKAKGGFGLIITEDYAVNEHAMGYQYIGGFWKDEQIASHRLLTERIHQYDTKIFCQIYHAGRQSSAQVNGEVQPIAPSPIACPWGRDLPREATINDIQQIVKDFGNTARRAKEAGFDGVEIHAGNGYLISGFMSFHENKRTDQYGGCFTNRMRFLQEVYQEVRMQVGPEYTVTVRFSADEHEIGGRDLAESRMIVKMMEEMGFDAINCSNGVYGTYNPGQVAPMYMPHAWTIQNAAEVKKLVNIPVLGVNRINDPQMADTLLEMGYCDVIGMARGSLADPWLPHKAKTGQLDAIRYCVGCMQGCVGGLLTGEPFTCLVNPEMGKEYLYTFAEKVPSKDVLVIGGGVSGMEAAIAASKRGHKVTLVEKSNRLGGQFLPAAYPPGKGEFSGFLAWLIRELKVKGVEVLLNTEATTKYIQERKPDKVILAAGSSPSIPPIQGIDRDNVVTAEDILLGNKIVQGRIIIAGGGEVGLETAIHLAYSERGDITIVEMLDSIASDMNPITRVHALRMAADRSIKMWSNTKIVEINDAGITLEQNGSRFIQPCDAVVVALGYKPNTELYTELDFLGDRLFIVGKEKPCTNALIATDEGFAAGYNA